jgi:hypothetical protein
MVSPNARRSLVLAALGFAFCLAIPGFSQTQVLGTISGTVSDKSGAVIPDATITATNKGTTQATTATTNDAGYFVFTNLPAGTYDVAAEKTGFQRCVRTGVILDPAGRVEVTCTMDVGQVTQTVEVQAQALVVQTEEAKVSRVLNSTQITEIPTNGRNFASLLGIQPGVIQAFSFNSFQAMSLFATQCTSVNGLRGDQNNIQVEGSPSTRTRANGAIVAGPSLDAIGEINIVTTGYMPEYSRGAGGQVLLQMKSGTSDYHGDAYEFLRNTSLDARNFFSPTVTNLKYNNFGYTIGGPIIPHHNKLFFFWAQEWSRIRTSSVETATVPTDLNREGNFSDACAAGLPCPTVPAYLNGVDGLTSVPGLKGSACASSLGAAAGCFPGNTIPSNLFSPNGAAMVQLYGAPTSLGTGTNWVQNVPSPSNEDRYSLKVDYQIDKIKSHLAVALRHYYQDTLPSWGTAGAGTNALLQIYPTFPERGGTFDLNTNFSPTLLNDFTFTATEDIVHVNLGQGEGSIGGITGGGPGLDRNALGIDFPYIFGPSPTNPANSKDIAGKIPTVNVTGFASISGLPYPSGSNGRIITLQDILTKVHGKHMIKGGVWWEWDGENDHDQVRVTPGSSSGIGNNLNGTFTFDASNKATTTGAPLADAILGNFGTYSELGFRNQTPWRARQIGLFGQDNWKVTPRLTIQGGLRWDYFPPYHSNWCNFATFNPANFSNAPGIVGVVNPTTGLVSGVDGGPYNPYNGISVPCQQLPTSAIGHFAVFGQELTAGNLGAINQDLRYYKVQTGLSPSIFPSYHNLFEPRLGFAWDPWGKGTTSIRGGAGIFYNHFTLSDVTLMGGNTPFQLASEVITGKADCPGYTLTAQQQCGPPPAAGFSGLPLPIPITGQSLLSQVPGVYQWNFSVQHQFPQDTLVELAYVGTRGRHMVVNSDLNQLQEGTLDLPQNAGVQPAALFPYQGLGGLTTALMDTNSKYDALQVSVQRRLNKGLQFGVAYTYSNTFDYGSDLYANAIDTYNLAYNYGPANYARRNNLIINYVYQLPFFKGQSGAEAAILGGWQLSGVLAFTSGVPYSIVNSTGDVAGVNSDFGQTGNRLQGCNPNNAPRDVAEYFNTACFVNATTGTFGTAGRNSVWGPGNKNWDFALFKTGKITERFNYQFRAEFFNFLNHPSFGGTSDLGNTIGAGNYGQITGANDPREIQFGLKLLW